MPRTKLYIILLIVVLGGISTYLNRDFRLDDALIYHRYIENFIDGKGLVYNEGEKFNALTSPLYIFISITFSSVTQEVETTQVILSGIILILAAISLIQLFSFLKYPVVGYIAAFMLITSKYFYIIFGMESNLFILMSILCIYFYLKGNYTLLSVSSALLFLTRGEGVFLLLVLLFFIVKDNRDKIKLKYAAIFIAIVALNYLFNYVYYGDFLPHTLTAKIAQGNSNLWYRFAFLTQASFLVPSAFNNQVFYLLFLFNFALIGAAYFIREKISLILVCYVNLLTMFYLFFNIPNYHWYYTIHILTLIVFASFGSVKIFGMLSSGLTNKVLRYSLIGLIFIYPFGTQLQMVSLLQKHEPDSNYKAIGEWLNKNTPQDSKLAMVEIGHLGWYSKRYIIDILGLVNPQNAEFIGQRQYDKWFDVYTPDYVLIHEPYWVHEQGVPNLIDKGYLIEDSTFKYDGFKLYKLSPEYKK